MTLFNGDGVEERHVLKKSYGYEKYEPMLTRNILAPVVESTHLVDQSVRRIEATDTLLQQRQEAIRQIARRVTLNLWTPSGNGPTAAGGGSVPGHNRSTNRRTRDARPRKG